MSCHLLDFDLRQVLTFASEEAHTPKQNKRRKREVPIGEESKKIDGISNDNHEHEDVDHLEFISNTLTVLGPLTIDLLSYSPDSGMVTVAPGMFEFVSDDIKLSVQDHVLLVKNCKLGSLRAGILFTIQVDEDISDQIGLLNLAKTKLSKNGLAVPAPLMKLILDTNSNLLLLKISYKVLIRCELFKIRQPDVVQRINGALLQKATSSNPSTAQLFYTAIANNTATLSQVQDFDVPELETTLLPFQRKTLHWLLNKENVKFDSSSNRCIPQNILTPSDIILLQRFLDNLGEVDLTHLDNLILRVVSKFFFGWQVITIANQEVLYNKYTANLLTRRQACKDLYNYYFNDRRKCPLHFPAQALLAEEMGLGKTVEITALILLNQRPIEEINEQIQVRVLLFDDAKTIVQAKTTLVISPDSILKQWVEEMIRWAPSLAVTVYKGVGKYPKLDNNPALIAEYLRKFDVVFTTYSTILKELDYALYSSRNKSTRNSKAQSERVERADKLSEEIPEVEDSVLLDSYKALFQITINSVKPKIANVKSIDGNDLQTDYEKALQDEISLAIKHNRVPSIYKKVDYESPLMLTQFWRVVLDEVQMVSSKILRAFQLCALIPRFHAWGVLGTPIKKNLDDLHLVLNFLKYQPFSSEVSKTSWDLLISNHDDFVALWTDLALRHTKAMVHDDIKLPPQNRVLLTVPFTHVEQDLYNLMFEECLAAIGLDVNGNPMVDDWEPLPSVMLYMSVWLLRLRQVCCNPQIGNLNLNTKKYRKTFAYHSRGVVLIQQLKTLENILEDMLNKAHNEMGDVERQLIPLFLELGEFYEFIYEPSLALKFLVLGSGKTKRIIHRLKMILERHEGNSVKEEDEAELAEKIRLTRTRIRHWNITLHRFYFLIASSYFQSYDEEYRLIVARYYIPDIPLREQLAHLFVVDDDDIRKDEIALLVNNVPVEKLHYIEEDLSYDGEEKERWYELKYYELAEETRRNILLSSMEAVELAVRTRIISRGCNQATHDNGLVLLPKTSKRFFISIPLIQLDTSAYSVSTVLISKLDNVVYLLNVQASVINEWMKELVRILTKTLISHGAAPDGAEYEESVNDQDKAASYLLVLGKVLTDRHATVNGVDGETKVIKKKDPERVSDVDFLKDLQHRREQIKPNPGQSLQELVLSFKTIEAEIKGEETDYASNSVLGMLVELGGLARVIFENQKVALLLLQKELASCNTVFNTRIDYFKQLQQISDSVQTRDFHMERHELNRTLVERRITKFVALFQQVRTKMDKSVGKFRYLKGLAQKDDPDEEAWMCSICRSSITIGSLTQCGHKYCKDCLERWLRTVRNCPMCKSGLSIESVYNFTHHKPDLQINKINKLAEHDIRNLHSIYKPVPPEVIGEIELMSLPSSYSTKVDMIVKQAMYLRSKDPHVQIVIFSQWQDMLYILGTALKAADISYLGLYGTLTPESKLGWGNKNDAVETFKDPLKRITCFLLNARAQALGLNLVNATHIFLCEPLINTSLELQAILRIHRIGQKRPTTVWMFAVANTVEESIVVMGTKNVLKYLRQDEQFVVKSEADSESNEENIPDLADSVALSMAESMTLMSSEGLDKLINKATNQGEHVRDSDLWGALFLARL